MKKLIFAIIIGFLLNPGFPRAQPAMLTDTLMLHDGKIMIGKILRYNTRKGAMIQMGSGALTEVLPQLIKSMSIQPTGSIKKSSNAAVIAGFEKTYAFRETGMYVALQGGALFGLTPQDNPDVGFGLQATAGYMLHRLLGVGAGAGFDNYSVTGETGGRQVLPLYAEVRGYITSGKRAPYYVVQTGYGIAFKNENQGVQEANGGFMMHPAIGLRLGAREDVNFSLDFGYRFQRVIQTREFNPWSRETQEERIWYKRFSLRIGMLF